MDAVENKSLAPALFDYAAIAPSVWGLRLESLKENGHARVTIPVLWGVHEQLRGIREFSKPTRLRLERALSTAQEKKLLVDLVVGFPPHAEAFPQWTHSLEPQAMVPLSLWEGERTYVGLKKIPSLVHPEVCDAFVGFLEEVYRIIRLYFAPEGPVAEVRLDFGILAHDLSVCGESGYRALLGERYGDISKLNRIYGTAFRDFDSALSGTGLRVMCDKRPWLAAFDLKWCRNRRLNRFETAVRDNPRLKGFFRAGPDPSADGATSAYGIGFDPTLVEGRAGIGGTPALPGGLINHPSAIAYRLWEYLTVQAEETKVPVYFLGDRLPNHAVHTVACGPFLARHHADSLGRAARSGSRLFFPFGLPKYDEDLSAHSAFEGATSFGDTELGSVIRVAVGEGECLVPAGPPALNGSLWGVLEKWRAALS